MRAKQRRSRRAVTLLETIIVLVIISALLALLLPAVQKARDSVRNASCKNNLHQLALAMHHFLELNKKFPAPPQPKLVSGWAIAILPYMEDRILGQDLAGNPSISDPSIAQQVSHRPLIMTCPFGWEGDSSVISIPASHYAMETNSNRDYFRLSDVPVSSRVPWVESPELQSISLSRDDGPHDGGYYIADSQGDVRWEQGE
jgi:type II secretory pathway pseudopilin PulG